MEAQTIPAKNRIPKIMPGRIIIILMITLSKFWEIEIPTNAIIMPISKEAKRTNTFLESSGRLSSIFLTGLLRGFLPGTAPPPSFERVRFSYIPNSKAFLEALPFSPKGPPFGFISAPIPLSFLSFFLILLYFNLFKNSTNRYAEKGDNYVPFPKYWKKRRVLKKGKSR